MWKKSLVMFFWKGRTVTRLLEKRRWRGFRNLPLLYLVLFDKETFIFLTLRRTAKLPSLFLRNMHKYMTVKSCIFCSKLQLSDDHHFVNKKGACTYWGNFVFYIQKLVIWTKWCYFLRFLISITLFSGFSWKSVIVTWKRKNSIIWFK